MKISKLFALIVVADCVLMGLFAFFFARPVSYVEYSGDDFQCMVPAGSAELVFEEDGWNKNYFSEKGELYISHYRFQGTFDEELQKLGTYLKGAVFQQDVKIFDNGRFFLYAHGKSWRKYLYLFSCGQEIFWVENTSRHSTLLTYKEVADRAVITMKIRGRGSDASLTAVVSEINGKIIRYAQSPVLLLGILGAVFLATTLVLPGILIYAGGIVPALEEGKIIRMERRVYVSIRSPWTYKGTYGTLVLTTEGLALYYFRRPMVTFGKGEGNRVSLGEKGGKSFLVVQKGKQTFRIYATDPYLWMNDIGNHLV